MQTKCNITKMRFEEGLHSECTVVFVFSSLIQTNYLLHGNQNNHRLLENKTRIAFSIFCWDSLNLRFKLKGFNHLLTDFKKWGRYQFVGIFFFFFFFCLCSTISFYYVDRFWWFFLLESGCLLIGPILIWSSSEYDNENFQFYCLRN